MQINLVKVYIRNVVRLFFQVVLNLSMIGLKFGSNTGMGMESVNLKQKNSKNRSLAGMIIIQELIQLLQMLISN